MHVALIKVDSPFVVFTDIVRVGVGRSGALHKKKLGENHTKPRIRGGITFSPYRAYQERWQDLKVKSSLFELSSRNSPRA
jgi:hypothetical protein